MQITEEDLSTKAVLTSPLSLDSDESKYRAPNIIKRILSLLSNVRPGSDLTHLQLPPLFNIPKSQLQCYGEALYCINTDKLGKCAKDENALDRFVSVVAWSLSNLRPLPFGVAPYNSILGETHHVSKGTLNVLLEQVLHHPPVTALHATDEETGIEMLWCQNPQPKFYGTHIETEVHGKRQLKLLDKNETYTMNAPKLVIRFFPIPSVEWIGNVKIRCEENGLEAELSYKGNTFIPRPSIHRLVTGKIFKSSMLETLYKINGHWDRIVTIKDASTGKTTTIYNAEEALSNLKIPRVMDPKSVLETESTVVWGEVSRAILEKNWDKAREAKIRIEESQRERRSRQEDWCPKHFTLSQIKENDWECLPKKKIVPRAPIVV